MQEDERRRPLGIGEGIRNGVGVLSALASTLADTVEEVITSDAAPERARRAVEDAVGGAQEALFELRERLDVVSRRDFEELRSAVAELSRRVDELEGRPPAASDHLLPPQTPESG